MWHEFGCVNTIASKDFFFGLSKRCSRKVVDSR